MDHTFASLKAWIGLYAMEKGNVYFWESNLFLKVKHEILVGFMSLPSFSFIVMVTWLKF